MRASSASAGGGGGGSSSGAAAERPAKGAKAAKAARAERPDRPRPAKVVIELTEEEKAVHEEEREKLRVARQSRPSQAATLPSVLPSVARQGELPVGLLVAVKIKMKKKRKNNINIYCR